MDQAKRISDFQCKLKDNKLDGFIVTSPINIFYLCGFRGVSLTEREAVLVISLHRATLITARLYQHEARKLISKDLRVKIVDERKKIFDIVKKLLSQTHLRGENSLHLGGVRIGFEEENLTYNEYQEFKKALLSSSHRRGSDVRPEDSAPRDSRLRGNDAQIAQPRLIPVRNLVEDLRMIKTEEEIVRIEKAQLISQRAFESLVKTIKIGQIEAEIAQRLIKIIKSLGGEGLAFETIVASGHASSRPHYQTGRTKIKKGQVLLLDFGAKYQNYCADLSRTIFIGQASDVHKNIYNHVQNAQKIAITKITTGVKAKNVYHQANKIFKAQKLDKYFIHGLGHGVGLEIHERPYLRPKIDEALAENMIFSVEPALYLPWGGVRIEDLVLIKNDRAKILGKLSDRIIEI